MNVQITSELFSCMSDPHLIPVTMLPSKGVVFLIVAPAAHSAPEIEVNVIEFGMSSWDALPEMVFIEHSFEKLFIEEISVKAEALSLRPEYIGKVMAASTLIVATVIQSSTRVKPLFLEIIFGSSSSRRFL